MLLENIQRVAKTRSLNVVLTTHNPALLDALPDEAIPAVQVCFRDPKLGDSRLVTLEELDRFPELLAQGRLGELVSRGILDRYLKLPAASHAKRRSAADWFERLSKGVGSSPSASSTAACSVNCSTFRC